MTQSVESGRQQADPAAKDPAERAAAWAGPRWVWFGVLGGPISWLVHLYLAWGMVEVSCTAGRSTFAGIDLRILVPLATIVPAVVAAAALVVATRAAIILGRSESDPPDGVPARRIGRAGFMVRVGAILDGFSLLMIIFGGVAVIMFAPCER